MSCPSCYKTNKTSCDICGFKSIKSVDTNIYILECSNKTFYVGKTNNPEFRLEQHFTNNGSAWTKKYPPIRVLEIIPNCDDYDEDKFTLKYMKKYGVDNVRGGSFCQIELDEENINTINRMINGSTDKCYKCGGNHFVNNCTNNSNNNSTNNSTNNSINNFNKITCFRCLRDGHSADDCYAKTDKNGEELLTFGCEYIDVYCCEYCNKEFETEKCARFHENVHCTMKNKKPKQTTKSSKNKCFRCGRTGHYADNCYANSNVNGEII
jgi:predicted GIY-YIG superfamily endonuclease